jgi:Icc-related predicted phosphoesterase
MESEIMRFCCISDQHGNLKSKCAECDVLLHTGDPFGVGDIFLQEIFLPNFNNWLDEQPAKHKVVISGNHDLYFEKLYKNKQKPELNCHYLLDESIEIEGLKIYGSPWTPPFLNWAFMLPEEELAKKWEHIPVDTDVLLVHGPPYGILDECPNYRKPGTQHVGSKALREAIFSIRPKLVVFGHIHESYGQEEHEGIKFINCSVLNSDYKLVNKPVVVEL